MFSRIRVNISLSEQIPLSILESKNIQYTQYCEKTDDALKYAGNKNPNQPAFSCRLIGVLLLANFKILQT